MHAEQQIDQIRRRVFQGKKIPHAEKVFSLFQPRTKWISKGKAGGRGVGFTVGSRRISTPFYLVLSRHGRVSMVWTNAPIMVLPV